MSFFISWTAASQKIRATINGAYSLNVINLAIENENRRRTRLRYIAQSHFMKAIDVTDENFEQLILGSEKTVLLDFGADWCPPCKAMGPVVDGVAREFDGKAIVGKLDVDLNPATTAKYGVRNLPTFLFFKKGDLVDRVVGAVPKTVLEKKIASLL